MVTTELRTSAHFSSSYVPAKIEGHFTGKHIVTVEQFDRDDLHTLFAATVDLRQRVRKGDLIAVVSASPGKRAGATDTVRIVRV